MADLGKHGQGARTVKAIVSRRQELASQRFLKESEDRRVEREVRRHGLLANPVAYDVTGQ